MTLADVRLQLAKEEENTAKAGVVPHDISPSTFISVGLDLEDEQYVTSHSVILNHE
jgi:hypothetical protein